MSSLVQNDPISTSLNVMRRLPPSKIEQNLAGLLQLSPSSTDELLQRIDQPLSVSSTSPTSARAYLLSDYNRDGDSYRNPWTNKYEPQIEDGFKPSAALRELEVSFNEIFDSYRDLYYEGGVSSVYLWDLDDDVPTAGWAGCFLIMKDVKGTQHVKQGTWNSIHVVECGGGKGGKGSEYKLTTTIMVDMDTDGKEMGATNLAGSMTRQSTMRGGGGGDEEHVRNVGRMIEDMEIEMRSNMDGLYLQKTAEVVSKVRGIREGGVNKEHVDKLNEKVKGMKVGGGD
ncbi:hypothetical protein TrRE_jg1074 [Triparma retinervis]|uniref:F-actin-capping protein subunit beta n=1 Tax=Triparma retinervis TaxID=2557542 RepID=A0A9W6ZPE8_9STRA|nr:hypothetical protein TrRE_jg1074 [Triparma retinervis]